MAARFESTVLAALLDLHHAITRLDEHIASGMGLSPADVGCLEFIQRCGPLRPKEIAQRLDTHPATLTGRLARLERGGWITRTPSATDGRTVDIAFDPGCAVRIQAATAGVSADLETLLAEQTDVLPRFAELLRRLTGVVERHAHAGPETTPSAEHGR